jgi:TetR/AcrR family transcriptional regulator
VDSRAHILDELDTAHLLKKMGETQRRIFEASIVSFAEKGFAGSRTEEIAREAGVNKAMIYYYFESKENLYTTIIEMIFNNISLIVKEHVSRVRPETIDEDISSFIHQYIDFIYNNRIIVRVLAWEIARGGEILSRVIKRVLGVHIPTLVTAFYQAAEEGKVRYMDPRHFLISIIGMIVFYFISHPIFSAVWGEDMMSPQNIEQRKREVTDFILHAISPKEK